MLICSDASNQCTHDMHGLRLGQLEDYTYTPYEHYLAIRYSPPIKVSTWTNIILSA
jgi:hypothetical protein